MSHRFKGKTVRFLEENIGETLWNLVLNSALLVITHDIKSIIPKEQINKLNFIKIKNFFAL